MLENSWSVHDGMENCEKPVQNVRKRRSRSDKVGRFKYNQQLLKKAQEDIEEIKLTQRTILSGLKDFFHFKQPLIEKIACADEIDKEILQVLFEAGSPGVLPKDVAQRLSRFKVTRHQISRRILRMNKRLEKELGEHAAEKRGWRWALASFAFEAYRETENKDLSK
jgi:ATP-dependent RNA circularization protein (DNA/RNA ligase family)